MNSKRGQWLALAAVTLLAACDQDVNRTGTPPAAFGEANRQTMMAQVVDPDPVYDDAGPATSAGKAAQAAERYRKDAVKRPDRVRSTSVSSGSSTGSGSLAMWKLEAICSVPQMSASSLPMTASVSGSGLP